MLSVSDGDRRPMARRHISRLRAEVLALPREDQLTYALDLLDELTSAPQRDLLDLEQSYGLSRSEAIIVLQLIRLFPAVASRTSLMLMLYGGDTDIGDRIVDAHMCRIRRKVAPVEVLTLYGRGWALSQPLALRRGRT